MVESAWRRLNPGGVKYMRINVRYLKPSPVDALYSSVQFCLQTLFSVQLIPLQLLCRLQGVRIHWDVCAVIDRFKQKEARRRSVQDPSGPFSLDLGAPEPQLPPTLRCTTNQGAHHPYHIHFEPPFDNGTNANLFT